jgi:hypothetical protein
MPDDNFNDGINHLQTSVFYGVRVSNTAWWVSQLWLVCGTSSLSSSVLLLHLLLQLPLQNI